MDKLLAHIKLFRPLNLTISAATVILSGYVLGGLANGQLVIAAVLVVVFLNAAANALNDYMDYETDLMNRPERPLSTGMVKRNTALMGSILLFVLGTACTYWLPYSAKLVAVGIALPIMVLYSLRLKSLPLVGNISVASVLSLAFIFSGAAFGNVQPMIIPAVLAFGLTLARELVKDIADMEGDKKAGINTFPVLLGLAPAISLSVFFCVLVGLAALVPYWVGIFGWEYLLILILGVEIPLLASVVLMVKFPAISTAFRSAQLLKFSTIMGLLAVYSGLIYGG